MYRRRFWDGNSEEERGGDDDDDDAESPPTDNAASNGCFAAARAQQLNATVRATLRSAVGPVSPRAESSHDRSIRRVRARRRSTMTHTHTTVAFANRSFSRTARGTHRPCRYTPTGCSSTPIRKKKIQHPTRRVPLGRLCPSFGKYEECCVRMIFSSIDTERTNPKMIEIRKSLKKFRNEKKNIIKHR